MLASLFIFAVGGAMGGAAPNMRVLIVARSKWNSAEAMVYLIITGCLATAIQGIGGGGIASLTQIILSDLVPLQERGIFSSLIGM